MVVAFAAHADHGGRQIPQRIPHAEIHLEKGEDAPANEGEIRETDRPVEVHGMTRVMAPAPTTASAGSRRPPSPTASPSRPAPPPPGSQSASCSGLREVAGSA